MYKISTTTQTYKHAPMQTLWKQFESGVISAKQLLIASTMLQI